MAKYATDVWPNNAFQELPSCGLYSCATENGVCPCTGTVLYGSSSGNNNPASSETKAKCLTTAAAIHGSTALSRGKLTSGHWAHVPSGCSVQSRGDGAAHWNSYAGIGVKADYISVGKLENFMSSSGSSKFKSIFSEGAIDCNNAAFGGDPAVGKSKRCWCLRNGDGTNPVYGDVMSLKDRTLLPGGPTGVVIGKGFIEFAGQWRIQFYNDHHVGIIHKNGRGVVFRADGTVHPTGITSGWTWDNTKVSTVKAGKNFIQLGMLRFENNVHDHFALNWAKTYCGNFVDGSTVFAGCGNIYASGKDWQAQCNNPASSETKAKCLTTAAAIHGSTALSRGKLTSGHWAHVPSGCSVQSRGDGAAHWNSYAGIGVKADYISVGKTMQWYGANACSLKKAAQVFECSGYAKVYVSKIQRDNACKSSNYWVDRLLKATKATRTFINTAAATNFHASVIYRTSSNLFCGSTR